MENARRLRSASWRGLGNGSVIMKTFLKILTIFIAVGAVGGAVMMWMDPTGVSWGGKPMLDLLRSKMPWPDVLFKNHPWAGHVTLVCGIILMQWIVLEWWIWGFVTLSNIFFVLGLIEAIGAVCYIRHTR